MSHQLALWAHNPVAWLIGGSAVLVLILIVLGLTRGSGGGRGAGYQAASSQIQQVYRQASERVDQIRRSDDGYR